LKIKITQLKLLTTHKEHQSIKQYYSGNSLGVVKTQTTTMYLSTRKCPYNFNGFKYLQ